MRIFMTGYASLVHVYLVHNVDYTSYKRGNWLMCGYEKVEFQVFRLRLKYIDTHFQLFL